MSRVNIIEVGGRKVELFLSTWATAKLKEMIGGDISKLSEWLSDGDFSDVLVRFSKVLALLANAAIMKRNADIAAGLEQGEKQQMFPEDYFIYTMNAADIMEYRDEIYATIGMGLNFEVPEGVEIEEKDPDLAELEKEKNPKGRAAI